MRAFWRFGTLALAVGMFAWTAALDACPFCSSQGQTLTKEVSGADLVLLGTVTAARPSPDGLDGTCDVAIEDVIKQHPFLKDKKSITLPRYIPKGDVKFLVFCTLYKDRADPYRGMPVKDKEIVKYLKGAIALDEKNVPQRLEFFFPYLENPEIEISTDAYKEFAAADAKEVMAMVQHCDRTKLRTSLIEWLRSPDTATYRYGLYGYLLGQCGTPEDAHVLTELLDDPKRGLVSGVDGVLGGYVTLKPKDGWNYVLGLLRDSKSDFTRRYAALRTIRFFWEFRPDLIPQKDLVSAISILLDQADIADLAIEDLRKWKQWDKLDQVLGLAAKPSHDVPIVQRAILRYTLSCPDAKATAFVQEQRKRDPDKVKDVEELLRFDTPVKAGG